MKIWILAGILALAAFVAPAQAQQQGVVLYGPGQIIINSNNPLPIWNAAPPGVVANGSSVQSNALAQAQIAPVAGKTAWICGFRATSGGATAAGLISVTVQNILGGTQSYQMGIPAGVTLAATPVGAEFTPCIPATGSGVTIQVNEPAAGTGNTGQSVSAWGYWQ